VRHLKHVILSIVLLSLFQVLANAQQVLGSIAGTVFNATGAAMPDATVKAANIPTNLEVTEKPQGNSNCVIQTVTFRGYTVKLEGQVHHVCMRLFLALYSSFTS
jgi:hypothetical protein